MSYIDWKMLAIRVRSLHENGESGGDSYARRAIVEILGQEEISRLVDHYVNFNPGAELVRSILWLLQPREAMERCYAIYSEDPNVERRRCAIELLRNIADKQALKWIEEFLKDTDEDIQNWAIGIIDQLLVREVISFDEATPFLVLGEAQMNAYVRDKILFIRESHSQK